jgi:hypothetical protein
MSVCDSERCLVSEDKGRRDRGKSGAKRAQMGQVDGGQTGYDEARRRNKQITSDKNDNEPDDNQGETVKAQC